MDYSELIVELYNTVFDLQSAKFYVSGNSIRAAIQNMKEAYLPNPDWRYDTVNRTTDYNNPAHRCAYLHKYAMVHTGLLCEILQFVFQQSSIHRDLKSKSRLNICSLGGGPGTDVVSLLFILHQIFGYKQCSVSVVDYSQEWKQVFESIVNELRTGRYGQVEDMVSRWYFSYEYLSGDLLTMSYYNAFKVLQAVKSADIITMVKFISAAACDKTKAMVKKIFQNMKLGAMVIFVDNAAGGFDSMIREAAYECGMQSVYGPLQHYDYENPQFRLKRYGYTSQSKTKVCVEVWKKTSQTAHNTTQQLQSEFMYGPSRRVTASSSRNIRLGEREAESEGCCSII